jgi:glycogen synthase
MSEEKRDVRNSILFECAWEVANKVGGIYTVIKTKVPITVSEYGDRYCLIGPLSYKTAPMEVEAQEPTDSALSAALESMRAQGVKVLYGRWLIEGAPRVLLFDTGSKYSRLDEWKGDLWNLAGIPSPPNDHETNETIVFGYLVAWFLGEVCLQCLFSKQIVLTSCFSCSTCRDNSIPLSLHTSTNGRQDWLSHSAVNDIST